MVKLILASLICTASFGAEVAESYPGGGPKEKYQTDAKGVRSGSYVSYYEDGKEQEKGAYRNGQKQGAWTTYDEKGKPLIQEQFADGLRNGAYVKNLDGKPRIKATYAKGELTTPLGVFASNGKLERLVPYPRSQAKMEELVIKLLAPAAGELMAEPASTKAPYQAGKVAAAYQDQALHALQAIRMLAGSPWEDLVLDAHASDLVQHGAVLAAVQGFSHEPKKPADMDAAFFAAALEGTNDSLYWSNQGNDGFIRSLGNWLTDPAPEVGHRRWLLNVAWQRVGVGFVPPHTLLNVADASRAKIPDWEMICYPGQGYFPQQMLAHEARWSVMLNAAKYPQVDPKQVTIAAHLLDENYAMADEVKISGTTVDLDKGHPLAPAIIFKPELNSFDGKRVWIEVHLGPDGPQQKLVSYIVDFVPVALSAPSALFSNQ